LDAIDRQVAAARIAKMQGKVDIGALQALSPDSFAGADESQHQAIAHSLTQALGVIANAATNRVINAHADSGKLNDIEHLADSHKDRPGVVFARSLDAVDQIKARLEAKGHRVIVVTGKDSSKDKAAKIRAFNPDSGERKADIVVCSDAGAVGANLQSGSWLAQYDTPDTAMVYNQRAGRIARVGQRNDVDLYDLVANHRSERRSRARLARKQDLREVVTNPLDGLDDTGLASFLFKRNQTQQQAMAM
jgi:superfamily II DNA/RNA helicase